MFRNIPGFIKSDVFISPAWYTMAQGGFPTGSMNENEQQIVTGSMKKSGSIPIATA